MFSLSHSFCALGLLLASSSLLVSASSAGPNQCVTFDASWNLLAFNFDGKDYNAGPLPSPTSAPKDITSQTNRPPFNVPTSPPLCFLSQFTNAVYVLNADATDRTSVYIFDAAAGTWTKQLVDAQGAPASYDPSVFGAILDRDTNVFYALSAGTLWSLDMALLKAANVTAPLKWNEVQDPELGASGDGGSGVANYEPVMALAQNHIHFLGVPGMEKGDAKVFVIHFSYMQPEPQAYGSFPTAHGKTASFFKDTGVQTQFAYIPDDGSQTFVVDVISNTTRAFPGPAVKDPYAMYAASPSALVQLASEGGAVHWMAYDPNATETSSASWKSVSAIPAASNTPGKLVQGSSGTQNRTTSPGGNGTANANSNANPTRESGALGGVSVAGSVVMMGVVGALLGLGALGVAV